MRSSSVTWEAQDQKSEGSAFNFERGVHWCGGRGVHSNYREGECIETIERGVHWNYRKWECIQIVSPRARYPPASGPIQWARGDVGVKSFAAARPGCSPNILREWGLIVTMMLVSLAWSSPNLRNPKMRHASGSREFQTRILPLFQEVSWYWLKRESARQTQSHITVT